MTMRAVMTRRAVSKLFRDRMAILTDLHDVGLVRDFAPDGVQYVPEKTFKAAWGPGIKQSPYVEIIPYRLHVARFEDDVAKVMVLMATAADSSEAQADLRVSALFRTYAWSPLYHGIPAASTELEIMAPHPMLSAEGYADGARRSEYDLQAAVYAIVLGKTDAEETQHIQYVTLATTTLGRGGVLQELQTRDPSVRLEWMDLRHIELDKIEGASADILDVLRGQVHEEGIQRVLASQRVIHSTSGVGMASDIGPTPVPEKVSDHDGEKQPEYVAADAAVGEGKQLD